MSATHSLVSHSLRQSAMRADMPPSLANHLRQCRAACGLRVRGRAWAERVHRVLAPRMMTMVVGATVLLAACNALT